MKFVIICFCKEKRVQGFQMSSQLPLISKQSKFWVKLQFSLAALSLVPPLWSKRSPSELSMSLQSTVAPQLTFGAVLKMIKCCFTWTTFAIIQEGATLPAYR